jgi:hypothetical protein
VPWAREAEDARPAAASDDIYRATTEQKPFGLRDYVQRLNELPGDWPAPPAAPS